MLFIIVLLYFGSVTESQLSSIRSDDQCIKALKTEINVFVNNLNEFELPSEDLISVIRLDFGRVTRFDEIKWLTPEIIEKTEVSSNVMKLN